MRPGDAVRELEAPDPGLPVERARARVVLVRVPERAVVAGVDREVRVVAPATERVGLAAGAGEEGGLALRQRVQRVARQPPRVADLRVDAGDEALKPTAMSPRASIAALPIQRHVASGW